MAAVEKKEVNKYEEITSKLNDILKSDDFKKKYIIEIKRQNKKTFQITTKEVILADGLRFLANVKGIKSLTTNIIQYPTVENNNCCIVQAYLIGYDINPITNELQEVEYSAIGDATPENCSVPLHFIRMAETRSTSRVFRNYTNVAMVAFEELDGKDDLDDSSNRGNNNTNRNTNNRNVNTNNNTNNKNSNYATNKGSNANTSNNNAQNRTQENKSNNQIGRTDLNEPIRPFQLESIKKIIKANNISNDDLVKYLRTNFNIESINDLTYSKAIKAIRGLSLLKS